MLTTWPTLKALNARVATSSPLPPPYMPRALPLGLLMSYAELNPVQAGSPKSLSVELLRNVVPLPLVAQALPQPPLLFLDQEYIGDKPEAVTENVAVEP